MARKFSTQDCNKVSYNIERYSLPIKLANTFIEFSLSRRASIRARNMKDSIYLFFIIIHYIYYLFIATFYL